MQQNIKATLILKRCQTSLPSCNAPFPSHSFHFFGQLKNHRGWGECFLASHLHSDYMQAVTINNQRAGSPRIEAMWGNPSITTTSLLNQLGLGGTNHHSMGVASHIKPHWVTDVNNHHGSHVWTRQIQKHVDHQGVKYPHSKAANNVLLILLAALKTDMAIK